MNLNLYFAFLMVAVFMGCTGSHQERRSTVVRPYVDSCDVKFGPHIVTLYGEACNSDVLNEEKVTGEENSEKAGDDDENLEKTDESVEKEASTGEEGKDAANKDAAEEMPKSGNIELNMQNCRKICPTNDPVATYKMTKYFRNAEEALEHAHEYNVECFHKGVDGEKGTWKHLRPTPKGKELKWDCPKREKGADSTESSQPEQEAAEDTKVTIQVKDIDVSECFSLKHIHDYVLENRQSIAGHSKLYGFDVLSDQGQSLILNEQGKSLLLDEERKPILDQATKEMMKKLDAGMASSTAISRWLRSAETPIGTDVDQSSDVGALVVQPESDTLVQLDEFVGRIVSCESKRKMIVKNFYGDFSGDQCEVYEGNKIKNACEVREYHWNGHGLNLHEEEGEDGRIMLVRKGRFVSNEEAKESAWYKAWHYVYWTKNDPSNDAAALLSKAQSAAEDGDGNYQEHSKKWQDFLRATNPNEMRAPEEIREERKAQQKAAEEYREQKGI